MIKKVHVFNKNGYVELVDVFGSEDKIVAMARRSFDGKGKSSPEKLFRHLIDGGFVQSPFEHVSFTFDISIPQFAKIHFLRHRTGKPNEVSGRYVKSKHVFYTIPPEMWRRSDGSYLSISDGEILSREQAELHEHIINVYERRLEMGVAKELARIDLPLSSYTSFYWTMDMRNLFNFFRQRCARFSQYETRAYAWAMFRIVESIFPVATDVFDRDVMQGSDYTVRPGNVICKRCKHACIEVHKPVIEYDNNGDAWIAYRASCQRCGNISEVHHDQSQAIREIATMQA